MDRHTYQISISGTVQGVGFCHFVYQLVSRMGLHGTVLNGTEGVKIFLNASKSQLDGFIESLKGGLAPLAKIDNFYF